MVGEHEVHLDARAEAAEQAKSLAAIRQARAKCREKFGTPKTQAPETEAEKPGAPRQVKAPALARSGASDLGDPPFLVRPLRWQPGRGGRGNQGLPARIPSGFGP